MIGDEFGMFEMYDSTTKSFAILQPPSTFVNTASIFITGAFSIGRKILIFKRFSSMITIFDLDKNEWSEKYSKATKDIGGFKCLKLPKI